MMDDPGEPLVKQVTINWVAYYRAFEQLHGGNPIPHKGKLLFRDAWLYSSTDHSGPEWAPPDDPSDAKALRLVYWTERRKILGLSQQMLQQQLMGLRSLQAKRSAALQQTTSTWDDEQQKRVSSIGPIDYSELEREVGYFDNDLRECAEQLTLLQSTEQLVQA